LAGPEQGPGQQGRDLLLRITEIAGALQLLHRADGVALLDVDAAEQETGLGEVAVLLQGVLELNACRAEVLLFHVGLGRRKHLLGTLPAACEQGRRQRSQGHAARTRRPPQGTKCIQLLTHATFSFFRPKRPSRSYREGRLIPRISAARAMFPLVRAMTLSTALRSASSRTARRFRCSRSSSGTCRPRSVAVSQSPSAMITARLMQFSSSRTLPGHLCASMADSASSASVGVLRALSRAKRCAKACASSVASPSRSRRDGISMTISASR